ncbi:ABC transporter substrate-binding protein [Halomicroarcula salina]|uniref:ABC transporter substrate-binding protein n=1 Tax=Haloarcula salina TaxID=1429914 RepID=A0AA41KC35_9EURY|nr:ABC transporter substrate-binding protein [Haloarcula salina]MBV0901930.1 ABC transporter substrate-binding protein [Haloarcula salina]
MVLGKPKTGECRTERCSSSRRRFLKIGGVAAASCLSGCTSVLGGNNLDTLSIAYKPIFPFLQFLVMDERGYLSDVGPDVESTNFANQGLNIVSAYSDGDVDVAFIGITPAIRMKHKEVPGKVTAANQTGGFAVLTSDEFASLFEEHGADAFQAFREEHDRKFRFSTFPKGSVAYVLLRQWLDAELGVGTEHVETENMAGLGPVKRSLLSGNADGTLIMEPIPTILAAKDAPFRRIAHTGEFMEGPPGGIMFMHDRLWDENPGVAKDVLRAHIRATELINEQPAEAAQAVSTVFGDSLSTKLAERAIRSEVSNYITDPRTISAGTERCIERMHSLGQIADPVSNEAIFEPSLYEDATE